MRVPISSVMSSHVDSFAFYACHAEPYTELRSSTKKTASLGFEAAHYGPPA